MASAHTAAAAAALRSQYMAGGYGHVVERPGSRPLTAESVKGVQFKGGGGGGSKPLAQAGGGTEQAKIDNLQKQVLLLEHHNRELRHASHAAGGGDGGGPAPHAAEAFAQREQELIAQGEQLRKEALSAKLRERRAIEDVAEAKRLISEQREKFTVMRQELTAEVVAYQRDLDELLTTKRQLEADLADALSVIREREQFVQGFDGEVRLLRSQLQTREEEAARYAREAGQLRVELNEEQVRAAAVQEKHEALRSHQQQLEEMRSSKAEEAERATVDLRQARIQLEAETHARTTPPRVCLHTCMQARTHTCIRAWQARIQLEAEMHARKKADDDKNFLVREVATLERTIQELSASADFISVENSRLKRDAATNKVSKVVGRFMVRKMQDRLGAGTRVLGLPPRARTSSTNTRSLLCLCSLSLTGRWLWRPTVGSTRLRGDDARGTDQPARARGDCRAEVRGDRARADGGATPAGRSRGVVRAAEGRRLRAPLPALDPWTSAGSPVLDPLDPNPDHRTSPSTHPNLDPNP